MIIDVRDFIPFNEDVGMRVGDAPLFESINRIGDSTTDAMMLFTIAGDEWVLATNTSDKDCAESIAKKILSKNGQPVTYEGISKPLYLILRSLRLRSIPYS